MYGGAGEARLELWPVPSEDGDLSDTRLLSGLPAEVVADFRAHASCGRYRAGAPVFVEGEKGDRVHLLVSGKVKITRPGPDGKEILYTMAGPGELLGELCVFDGGCRHATATAVHDSVTYRLDAPELRAWLARHPQAAFRMMRLLAARVRRANDLLEDVRGADVGTRVARALVEQGGRFGRSSPLGVHVVLDLNQDELAHYVNASRERVNQVLMDFSRRGWLLRQGEEWLLRDAARLTRRARYRPETADRRPHVTPTHTPRP